ncbi:MAG: IS110 family transposase [Methylotenera sp.]|nr:IS110 family transposase [Methylotenera sp.]
MAFIELPILGIDISKAKFDVALLVGGKVKKSRVFDNNLAGFKALSLWLIKQDISHLQACMEATGTYGDELATYLVDQGFEVSVVNPAQIKSFSGAQLNRAKTDKADAKLIAQFCASMHPMAWVPPPVHVRELQALVQRLAALLQMERQELNRFGTAAPVIQPSIKAVLATIKVEIKAVERMIRDHIDRHPDLKDQSILLDSIPGIGVATIARLLAFVGDVHRFNDAKALAAFVGLNPTVHQSGSSVRGKSRLSKKGNATIRKALYMPAIVARRYNPIIKAFAQRLKKAGKSNMLIIGAVMRKLLHIIYGVLKSGKPFDADYAVKNA